MADGAEGSRLREPRRALLWAALVVALGFLGRATVLEGTDLSMVWPAAGAAVLWVGTTSLRGWPLALAGVALTTGAANLLGGASWSLVPVFMAANLVQTLVCVVVLRAAAPELWAAGGREALRTTRQLWLLVGASAGGSLAGALVGNLGLLLLVDAGGVNDLLAWWGRNLTGIVAVVGLALLLRRSGGVVALGSHLVAASTHRGAELVGVLGVTALLYVVVFGYAGDLPVAFPLLIATVWVGLRFDALVAHLHSLAAATSVVVLTHEGIGPFGEIDDVALRAMVPEVFVGLLLVLGLALAVVREEKHALLHELAEAHRESADQAAQLATLVQSMRDGVTLVDAEGVALFHNRVGPDLVGALGSGPDPDGELELLSVDLTPIEPEDSPVRRAFDAGQQVVQDVVVRRRGAPDSERRLLEVSVTPLPTDADRALVVYRDVTTERDHLRSVESFAAVVAHDLNTPLTVIDGWVDVVVGQTAAGAMTLEEALPALGRVQRAAGTMRELIRDLLAFSTAAHSELSPQVVDLTELARDVALVRREALGDGAGVVLVGDLPQAMVEPALVRQVLDNLIGNAIKYVRLGQQPGVTVTGRTVGRWVEVTVADNGIGIPADKQHHVFDAFYRAHTSYDGHGLGLSICRRIIDRYGGVIRAQDNPDGPGTAIVFTVPAATRPTAPAWHMRQRATPLSRER